MNPQISSDAPGGLRWSLAIGPAAVALIYLVSIWAFGNLGWVYDSRGMAWGHLPLDDAWIHLSYAERLGQTGYFAYNDKAPETGATSPLWVVVLALAGMAAGGGVVTAKVLGVVLGMGAVAGVHVLLRGLAGATAGWVGSVLLAVDPMWAWAGLSGMEVTLTGLTLVALVWQAGRGVGWGLGVAMGAAALARPEMAVAAGMAWVLAVVEGWRRLGGEEGGRRRVALGAAASVGTAAAMGLPWLIYCRWATGRWLPNTFYAKGNSPELSVDKFKVIYDMLEHGYWPSAFLHDPLGWVMLALGWCGWGGGFGGGQPRRRGCCCR